VLARVLVTERTCLCGCGRTFVPTNHGSDRLYFDRLCQRRAKQRLYNKTHPEQRQKNWLKYSAKHRDTLCEKTRSRYETNLDRERKRSLEKARRPESRNLHYVRNYGISLEEYERLLNEQGRRCRICRTDDPGTQRRNCSKPPSFAVDHDHRTGKVRGLLCERCNRGLGQFRDNAGILKAAISYLTEGVH